MRATDKRIAAGWVTALALLGALAASAADTYVGTIHSFDAGSQNNYGTPKADAGPGGGFTLRGPGTYSVQCKQISTVVATASDAAVALYGEGMEIAAEPGAPYDIDTQASLLFIAIKPDGGPGNCRVSRRTP